MSDKGNDLRTRLWAYRRPIVFPFFDSLVGYAKNMSHFYVGQPTINPRPTQVLAEGCRDFGNAPAHSPMDGESRK